MFQVDCILILFNRFAYDIGIALSFMYPVNLGSDSTVSVEPLITGY